MKALVIIRVGWPAFASNKNSFGSIATLLSEFAELTGEQDMREEIRSCISVLYFSIVFVCCKSIFRLREAQLASYRVLAYKMPYCRQVQSEAQLLGSNTEQYRFDMYNLLHSFRLGRNKEYVYSCLQRVWCSLD